MRLLTSTLLPLLALLKFTSASTTACNNSPLLCDKSYSNVTHLGAHDSPFLSDSSTGGSTAGDQYFNSTVQLSAGVRLLTAQVHNNSGVWHLCHTSCALLDAGTLESWLSDIKTWLDSNPNEVVTLLLVNSDGASASELASVYEAAGVVSYSYTPESTTTPPTEWPTLQTLINNGTRLMNFVADLDPSENTVATYLMDEFTFIFENSYDNTSPSDFNCTANRPSSVNGDTAAALKSNMMPFMNHFLYETQIAGIESPNTSYISTTNAPSGGVGNLGTSAQECTSTYGRAPTFILVDYFNAGPAIDTVDTLNGVTDAVGRTNVSTTSIVSTSSSGASGSVKNTPMFAVFVSGLVTVALMLV